MEKVYLAKQKILNRNNKVFAYELLFRDCEYGIKDFPTNMKATSHVLVNALTNINKFMKEDAIIFINVDAEFILSGLVNILDKNKFVLEILETIELNDKVIAKIKQYHKRGFKIAIDDFDCTAEMIKKFSPIFKYVHLVKMDVIAAESENLKNVTSRMKKSGLKLLAEKIETKEEHKKYLDMGFDLFQGFHLNRPEIIEIDSYKDIPQFVILNIIQLIKNDAETELIESYIKERPDLSYKLIKFLNNQENFVTNVESITQIITLLGRDQLLRWLLLYLYSEVPDDHISKVILKVAIKRAEHMEENAEHKEKHKAYMAGMFSMIGVLFKTENKVVLKDIKMDKDIIDLVIRREGKFLSSLEQSEHSERAYLKQLLMENFDKIDPMDTINTLESNGIHVDTDRL